MRPVVHGKMNGRAVLSALLIMFCLFYPAQSYLASPRPLLLVIQETADFIVLCAAMVVTFAFRSVRAIGVMGACLTLIGLLSVTVLGLLPVHPKFGLVYFLSGLWLAVSFVATTLGRRSILLDLLRGKASTIAASFVSTIALGAAVELANLPGQLWTYADPVPVLIINNLPVTVIFGWFPWVLAIMEVFCAIDSPQLKSKH